MDSPNLTCFRYSNIFHQLMKLSGIHLFCFGIFVIWFYFSPEKNLMPYYCWMHLRTIKTNKWKTVNRLLFRPCFRSTGQILHLGLYTQRLELQLKNYSFVPLLQQTAAQSGPHYVISWSREMHSVETIVANVIRSYTMSSVVWFCSVLFCALCRALCTLHAKLSMLLLINASESYPKYHTHTHAHTHDHTILLP